jgi:hypothetical protein
VSYDAGQAWLDRSEKPPRSDQIHIFRTLRATIEDFGELIKGDDRLRTANSARR